MRSLMAATSLALTLSILSRAVCLRPPGSFTARAAVPAEEEPRWSSDGDGWHWSRCEAFAESAGSAAASSCVLRSPGRPGALMQYYVAVCPAEVQCNAVGLRYPAPGEPWLPGAEERLSIEVAHHPSGALFTHADGWLTSAVSVPGRLAFGPASAADAPQSVGAFDRLTWRAPVDPFCSHAAAAAAETAPACLQSGAADAESAVPPLVAMPSAPAPAAENTVSSARAPVCTTSKYSCYELGFASGESAFRVTLSCGATSFWGSAASANATFGGGLFGAGRPRYLRAPCGASVNASVAVFTREVGAQVAAQTLLSLAGGAAGAVALVLLQVLLVPLQFVLGPPALAALLAYCATHPGTVILAAYACPPLPF